MTRPLHVFLVAVEPSGDALGAGLCAALRERLGEGVRLSGVGGAKMAAFGIARPIDMAELAIVGILDGLKIYPKVLRLADETVEACLDSGADAAILIDSWGFTIRVAERLRRRAPDFPIIKYVGPQVWASRPGRAAKLARVTDHVLTLQPFEPPYFESAGLRATFVGHPVLDSPPAGDGPAFRAAHGLEPDAKLVAVLFGSRGSEVRRLAEPFAQAVAALRARYGERLALVSPAADAVVEQVRAVCAADPRLDGLRIVEEGARWDVFAAADAALACSGTVVTEVAMAGTPAVVAYRLGPFTHWIAKRIVTAPHISLVNMAADARLLPELVQDEATGPGLADAVSRFLDDPDLAARTRAGLAAATARMRGEGRASERAAAAVIAELRPDQADGDAPEAPVQPRADSGV